MTAVPNHVPRMEPPEIEAYRCHVSRAGPWRLSTHPLQSETLNLWQEPDAQTQSLAAF